MAKPTADLWFGIECADEGLLRIRETHIDPYYAGNIWLAKGRDRDLLIDTGTGIVTLKATLSAITDRPIVAVALNCFYDHAGGLHEFDERLAHEADCAALESPTGQSSVADEFVSDDMLLALPHDGYSTDDYVLRPTTITRTLRDGDTIDLGDRRFDVMHTPLPTPGSICLWEAATGKLFTSDVMFLSPEGAELAPRNRDALPATLARLSSLPATTVHPGHYGSFGRDVMERVIRSLT